VLSLSDEFIVLELIPMWYKLEVVIKVRLWYPNVDFTWFTVVLTSEYHHGTLNCALSASSLCRVCSHAFPSFISK
jgi:hypothetical protein